MKAIEFKDYDFATQKDLFKALFDNQDKIINAKKSCVQKSSEKGACGISLSKSLNSAKGIEGAKEGFIYPIVSTTNFFDSHKDVHFDGCFNKTVRNEKGTVKYALDHSLTYHNILAWTKDVKMMVKHLDWATVGKNYEGQTEGLAFEISKDKITNKDVLKNIEDKAEEFENSIRMIYMKIRLGLNSDVKDHKKNKEYFEKKIDLIANKDEVMKDGYFWGVEELKIHKEASLVVAGGSNSATAIYEPVSVDSSEQKEERGASKKVWFY